jgi:carbon storage regulator
MLVLTRKLMEKLFIGDNICVTVVRLEGGQVRLGIEAPREVSVVRAELVPDRQSGPRRFEPRNVPPATSPPPGGVSGPTAPRQDASVTTPQASAHGIDNRRRGPSR